jgi:HK97 gp10 family phage protein
MKVTMKVEGAEKLAKSLETLSARVSRKVLMDALRAGAEHVRAAASRFAPREPGAPDLAENIGVSNARPDSGNAAVAIGPTKHFFYGKFQEDGTTRHGAQPFMRPAFDSEIQNALRTIRNRVWESLAKRGVSARTSGSGGIGDSFASQRTSVTGGAGGGGLL